MIFWQNKKFLKADDLLLLFLPPKNVFHFGRDPCWPLCSANWARKSNSERFYQFFFRTTGLQQKLIESPNIFHWKSTKKKKKESASGCGHRSKIWAKLEVHGCEKNKESGIINGLFSNFAWWIHLKQEVVVIEIPELKLKAKIARNITFEEN